ncbi:hypothetical protein MTR67_012877 [Solanum verrucosum]|uniref:Uncharacterized protein n=1 Tax=Solanum verrucosum TaxID=315347 RepID=A0AAF0TGC9_SOLVR|nr:hypothetical protein MTR67_012877 [Solanum verrucosum]
MLIMMELNFSTNFMITQSFFLGELENHLQERQIVQWFDKQIQYNN